MMKVPVDGLKENFESYLEVFECATYEMVLHTLNWHDGMPLNRFLELISRSDVARAIEKTTNVAEKNGRIHEASRLSDASL